ncbi:polysaccharide biosynthesis protein [Duganella lactea]|nr:nucleoside-diphosphate sugar epimerase/dehydratase [Duganella lactea]
MNQAFLATLSATLVRLPRRWKVLLMVCCDALAIPLCLLISMVLRLGGPAQVSSYGYWPYLLITAITVIVFHLSGLYRAVIRFIDKHLLIKSGLALAAVTLVTYLTAALFNDQRLPRTALMIYWFITFTYVVCSRMLARDFLRTHTGLLRRNKRNIAIFGAGEHGAQLALSMRASEKYQPLCFFDDKHIFKHHTVAGLKVYSSARVAEIIEEKSIQLIVLAIPHASRQRRRQVMSMLSETGCQVKMLSSLVELSDDKVSAQAIREVKIEDLLGRDMVPPQEDLFAQCVRGRQVLVTGAGGSIGSELCRQIAALHPTRLCLLDHSEYALFMIEQELRVRFPDLALTPYLGSVCDAPLVERILRENQIGTIYHAAAYKHVPLVESNVIEGIRNNVIGAQVIAAAAAKYQVPTCVLISSDKAVRPTNIMGASKRIAELIFQAAALQSTTTTFCMVRFGNVLGSSGSVVPYFQAQIANGGPITITHPDITRYFMLIPEAAQLVMQAGSMARGGEVFVLDMGEPIRIIDLARTMIGLVGLTEKNAEFPDNEIEIKYIGLRPGEKLYEELLIGGESQPSEHPRIMVTTEYALEPAVLAQLLNTLSQACATLDEQRVKDVVRDIVPEYAPQAAVSSPAAPPAPSDDAPQRETVPMVA